MNSEYAVPISMINVDLTMIGSLDERTKECLPFVFRERVARFSHLKNIETQIKAKAAEREMYCGRAQRR